MKMYSSIITKRICTSRFEPSLFEKGAYAAIDYHGAKEDFELLIVTDNEYYLCDCIEKSGRLRINAMQSAGHNLGTTLFNNQENKGLETCFQIIDGMVSIDPMFENMIAQQIKDIASSLSSIKPSGKGKLYLHGQLSESLLFRYALQKYYGVRELAIVDDEKPVKSDGRTLFPNSVFNEPLNLNITDGLIVKYITKPGCQMMLPLTDATLEAKVWNSSPLTWGDIIPDREADLTIAGVECKSITLNFSIDIFGNIISRVYGSDGKKAVRLFKNAMGAEIPDTNNKSTVNAHDEKPATENTPNIPAIPQPLSRPGYVFEEELIAKSSQIEGLTSRTAKIKNGSSWTYKDLIGDYLAGAKEIYLEEPYIAKYYQFENLKKFISTAIQASKLRGMPGLEKFHLLTFHADFAIASENMDNATAKRSKPEEALAKQEKFLKNLAKDLAELNIRFTYDFNDNKDEFHDRHAELSNGWYISMGRGLDIFKKSENEFIERTCRNTEFSFRRRSEIIELKEEEIKKSIYSNERPNRNDGS